MTPGEPDRVAPAPAAVVQLTPLDARASDAAREPAGGILGLGAVLVEQRWIDTSQLESAQQEAERTGARLSRVLLRRGQVSDTQLTQAIAQAYGLPHSLLPDDEIDHEAIEREALPFDVLERYGILPLRSPQGVRRLGMADPAALATATPPELARLPDELRWIVVPASRVAHWLANLDKEPPRAKVERLLGRIEREGVDAADGPVVRLYETLLSQAIREGASDVHLEPDQTTTRVRFRFDGVLHQLYTLPGAWYAALVSAIKMAADLNIAQRILPQDGKLVHRALGRPVDVRVAIFPSVHGESIVLRILDKMTALQSLDQLGYSGPVMLGVKAMLRRPHGLFLVTGPTGSGKTTTLYACLHQLASLERAIMTIEDPVEYELPLVKQGQVNVTAKFGFPEALRAMLRCDPDIMLVGEIRDRETAELACQAALTGHLVLSTLHTNSAPDAVTRLLDLGIGRDILASSLCGIAGQRLARRLCEVCSEAGDASTEEMAAFAKAQIRLDGPVRRLRAAAERRECPHCRGTGYRGRLALAEYFAVTPRVQAAMSGARDVVRIHEQDSAYIPLVVDGLQKIAAGLTTFDEIRRVAEWDAWSAR